MRKKIKLAVVAALALGTTSAFSTNGSILIGTGVKARAMGGMVVAKHHGAENGIYNAALLTKTEGTDVSFSGTLFMPDVATDMGGQGFKSSQSDKAVIPEISIANKISDEWYIGIGMWGTAGMGVDYRKDASNMKMVSALQLMQFGVPIAYKMGSFSIGITPFIQYGSLDMSYDAGYTDFGAGVSNELAFGYNLGASYDIENLTLGFVYTSQVDMEYDTTLSDALANFGAQGYTNNALSTPAGVGFGASYKMGNSTIGFEYRNIQWSDAKGYQDFNWEDQDVYIFGYEYANDTYEIRLGYNYASSPISEQDGRTGLNDAGIPNYSVNALNLLGFPATVESHYSMGGTYYLTKQTSIDLTYTYAPETTDTYTSYDPIRQSEFDITTKHSQTSVSFGLNYEF